MLELLHFASIAAIKKRMNICRILRCIQQALRGCCKFTVFVAYDISNRKKPVAIK